MNVTKIKKSKDYNLIYIHGKKINSKSFNLQYLNSKISYSRIGITASKKLGNAVVRNFIKRRIRSLVRKSFSKSYITVKDYVIVAKKGVLLEKYYILNKELERLLKRVDK